MLFVNFRLRDSRLGRPGSRCARTRWPRCRWASRLVRTKLLAYGTGAAFGGIAGAFLGSFLNTVNADQFQFSFSIFVLAMVILGGLGSIWGVVLGAIVLSFINIWLIPDVLNDVPCKLGLDFDLTQISLRDLRLPARDHDDPEARGPAAGTEARAGADGTADEHADEIRLRGTRMSATTNGSAVRPRRATQRRPSSSAA